MTNPPPNLKVSEWADAKRIISPESNPAKHGQWRTEEVPYLRGIMDSIAPVVVVMKSSRAGVTEALTNVIGYTVDLDPCAMQYVAPDKNGSQVYERENLNPMIRDCEDLGKKVLPPRIKGSDSTKLYKKFRGGSLKLSWATSPRQFRGTTIRKSFNDDLDGYPLSAGLEGDPFTLAKNRTTTVWNAQVWGVSSPTITGISRIEIEYGHSNQQHYYVPCPRCKFKQVLVFSKESIFAKPTNGDIIGELSKGYIKFDRENLTWACYVCENCSYEIPESSKRKMLLGGEWRAARPEITKVDGFHISRLYSPLNSTWLGIAQDFLESKRDPQKLKVVVNNIFGETFELDALTISDHKLLERVEDYEVVPMPAYILTAGVDKQGDRYEITVWAWGDEDERWLIEHEIIYRIPSESLARQQLDAYLDKRFLHESGLSLRLSCVFMDSGFDTHEVYKFTAPRERRAIFSIKGFDGPRKLIDVSRRDRRSGALLVILGVDAGKNQLYDSLGKKLLRADDGKALPSPGYVHLNKFANLGFVQQLAPWKRVRKIDSKGRDRIHWILPSGRKDEIGDTAVYAYAAKEFVPAKKFKRSFLDRVASHTGKAAEQNTETVVVVTPTEGEQGGREVTIGKSPKQKSKKRFEWNPY